jgi:hypothetical protein
MESTAELEALRRIPAVEALPEERTEWPDEADREYHRLMRELNAWSREHDWPMTTNSWIAEEAVRQSW